MNEGKMYKAQLVVKAYSQKQGIDTPSFSLWWCVKHTFISIILSIIAMHDSKLDQLDVNIAFLHGELEEQIYRQQLEGFE